MFIQAPQRILHGGPQIGAAADRLGEEDVGGHRGPGAAEATDDRHGGDQVRRGHRHDSGGQAARARVLARAGATDLGDEQVVLILDVAALRRSVLEANPNLTEGR